MRVAVFDTKPYDRQAFEAANGAFGHELAYFESRLSRETATIAQGFPAVCVFVNDEADGAVLRALHAGGTRLVALRCAGFNNVDLAVAKELGMEVVRVPAYSPHAVAEHAVALLLALVRHIPRAYNRVRDGNFTLRGLVGFDLHGKTVGVVGTGRIGAIFARIMTGFGCRVLAFDRYPDEALERAVGCTYVPLADLLAQSDVVSLHMPLTPETTHLIDVAAIGQAKPGCVLINTSRGGLVDTPALIAGLKSGRLGAVGLDVYEREAGVFFEDHSDRALHDDDLARLLTFPNVLITGHQAFLTDTALRNIAETTLGNIRAVEAGRGEAHRVG